MIELLEIIPEASRTARHWLHLARANERRMQLVEAFSAYERLLDVAVEGAAIAGMKDVERQARAESSELSHRIPWAEVTLDRALPAGSIVFVDQQWLEPSRLRSPYPVNPGWHTFLVESNGTVLGARRVFFEEGQSRAVPLNVLENTSLENTSDDASSGPAPGDLTLAARPARGRALAWHAESPPLGGERPENLLRASYISLGVGLSATAIGTGLAIAYSNTGDATRLGGATASYAVGFGALVTGGVLWLLYRDAERTPVNIAKLQVEPRLYPSGATVRGAF